MFWCDDSEWFAVFVMWVALMTVVGVYVIRIGLMLSQQRANERSYRLWLAVRRGRAVRERSARSSESAEGASS